MGYKIFEVSTEPSVRDPQASTLIFSARYEEVAQVESFEDALEVGMARVKAHYGGQVMLDIEHDGGSGIRTVNLFSTQYTHPVTRNQRVQAVPPVLIKPDTAYHQVARSYTVTNPAHSGPVRGWRQR